MMFILHTACIFSPILQSLFDLYDLHYYYMNKTRRCYKTATKAQLSHRGIEKKQKKSREIDG